MTESIFRLTGAAIVATGLSFGSFLLPNVAPAPSVSFAEADPAVKYGPYLRQILARDLASQVGQPGVRDAATLSLIIQTRSDVSDRLRSLGANVRSAVDGIIVTADVPVAALPAVAQIDEVVGIEAPVAAGPAAGLSTGLDPAAELGVKYGPGLRTALARSGATANLVAGDGGSYSLILRTTADISPRLTELGARVRSVVDGTLMTADVPASALVAVAQLAEVVALDTTVAAGPSLTAVAPAEDPAAKYGPALRTLLSQEPGSTGGQIVVEPRMLSVIIRTRSDISGRLTELGAQVRSVVGGTIVTADVPVSALPGIAQEPEVLGIDLPVMAGPVTPVGPAGQIFLPLVARS